MSAYIENLSPKEWDDVNGATKSLLRDKIQTEIQYGEVKKLKEILNDQKTKAAKTYSEWSTATGFLKLLRKKVS